MGLEALEHLKQIQPGTGMTTGEAVANYYDYLSDFFSEYDSVFKEATREEFYNWVRSLDFCNPHYNGKFKTLNHNLLTNNDFSKMFLGFDLKDFDEVNLSLTSEWLDGFYMPEIINKWQNNKLVYHFDPHFCEALMNTNELSVSYYQLTHLPSNNFYVDVSSCPILYPLVGAWTDVIVKGNYFDIYVVMLRNDYMKFSWHIYGNFKDGKIDFAIPKAPPEIYSPWEENKEQNPNKMNREGLVTLILQLFNYLYVKKPDMVETTTSTYKHSDVVKNKYSEVRSYDLGNYYGYKTRKVLKEIRRNSKRPHHNVEKRHVHHKPPRPHFRSAHWQLYHVGKGRTETEIKWIEPIFVGGKTEET